MILFGVDLDKSVNESHSFEQLSTKIITGLVVVAIGKLLGFGNKEGDEVEEVEEIKEGNHSEV